MTSKGILPFVSSPVRESAHFCCARSCPARERTFLLRKKLSPGRARFVFLPLAPSALFRPVNSLAKHPENRVQSLLIVLFLPEITDWPWSSLSPRLRGESRREGRNLAAAQTRKFSPNRPKSCLLVLFFQTVLDRFLSLPALVRRSLGEGGCRERAGAKGTSPCRPHHRIPTQSNPIKSFFFGT